MPIQLFITGGTIDASQIRKGDRYVFSQSHIPNMLKQSRCTAQIKTKILMMKDSIYLTGEDREKIVFACKQVDAQRIIVTHGTDTMVETARCLASKNENKTIVLTGAMIPFYKPKSDAFFNLGTAICAVQLLPSGVYISMNGKIFPHDKVRKNKKLGIFERIQIS